MDAHMEMVNHCHCVSVCVHACVLGCQQGDE